MPELRERLEGFIEELTKDLNRPNGRWGLHGNSCVDDSYFDALIYVIDKLEDLMEDEVL